MGDSPGLRSLARSHRDSGVPEVDYEDYDASSRLHWGGPAPKWFPEAMAAYPERFANQRGKVALITGGTSGIGLYAAKLLAAVGFALILPQRPGLAHEAAGAMRAVTADVPGATVLVPTVPLDLASFASVRAFGTHLREEERALCNTSLCAARRIDALLCNAGRGGGVHDEWELTGDGLEAIMQVNLLSHALLIAQLRPLLAASAHARVVLHSSSARHNAAPSQLGDLLGARRRLHPWGRYSLSKAAMCLAARALNAGRLQAAGIAGAACAADPGLAATGVNVQHDLAKSLGLTRDGAIRDTKAFHDRAAVHAADGALPLALAALSCRPNEMFDGEGLRATSLSAAARARAPSPREGEPLSWAESEVERLWAKVERATGLAWGKGHDEL